MSHHTAKCRKIVDFCQDFIIETVKATFKVKTEEANENKIFIAACLENRVPNEFEMS